MLDKETAGLVTDPDQDHGLNVQIIQAAEDQA
jgi:hypothetical protein